MAAIIKFIFNKGFSWFLFRIFYEIRKRTYYFNNVDKRIERKAKKYKMYSTFEFYLNINYNVILFDKELNIEQGKKAIDGKIYSFSNEYLDYSDGNEINWTKHPTSKYQYSSNLPWHKIPDFGKAGDIKLLWEASRFPQIYSFIIAFNATKDEKYANECINQIIDWIDKNPYPNSPNYKCGQEISFRLFSWIIAMDYFREFISNEQKQKIIQNIYISGLRINANISYAVKSVRNNHSVSEASGLFILGTLFNEFPEAKFWQQKGMKLLLQETKYQVNKDGSYIQQSMNYHRLVMDTLSFVFVVAKQYSVEIPEILYERHNLLIQFLASFVQLNGKVPNYGSNDGAYLFPLSDYDDFRPSLNFASVVNSNKLIFKNSNQIVDFFGLSNEQEVNNILNKKDFKTGGYYQLKNINFYAFTRCHQNKANPAHIDVLHLDLWHKGKNIFCDSGSYSYNTDKKTKALFSGIFGHNTIIINGTDFIQPVLNFGKSDYIKAKVITANDNVFEAEHYGYKKIYGIIHRRRVELNENSVIIKDWLIGVKRKTSFKQQWNTEFKIEKQSSTYKILNLEISSNYEGRIVKSKVSRFYNNYYESNLLTFFGQCDSDIMIETKIKLL